MTNTLLLSFIERIENLEDTRRSISNEIKNVYDEVKDAGFDTKTVREIVKIRSLHISEYNRRTELLSLYKQVLGMEDNNGWYRKNIY